MTIDTLYGIMYGKEIYQYRIKQLQRSKKNSKSGGVRIGLQIRNAIFNLMFHHPGVSVKIPTSVELAEQFGVARCTVTDELQLLVAEGFLIGKRGIGTFTNPSKIDCFENMPGNRIIGIVTGDSRRLFFDYTMWGIFSAVGSELIPDIGHPRPIIFEERDPKLIVEELNMLQLDGLVWILPPAEMLPVLHALRDQKMPLAVVYTEDKTLPGVEPDYHDMGSRVGSLFLAEGRKKAVWCAFDPWNEASRQGAIAAGFPENDIKTWSSPYEFVNQFPQFLASGGQPDAIYAHSEFVYFIIEQLKQHGLDPERDVTIVADYGSVCKMPDFKGIVRYNPIAEIGTLVAGQLARQFTGETVTKCCNARFKVERWK